MRTMIRTPSHNVAAIIMQRMVDEPTRMQQIQVVLSKDGRLRHTVLQPLSQQGMESVDDGRVTRTFIPDRKMVIEMPSPRLTPCDAISRIKLAERNYTLRVEDSPRVAGREAVLVSALPRSTDMAERRYTIDPRTGYLLKLETVSDGKATTSFETKFVDYPRELPRDVFEFQRLSGSVKVVVRTPQELKDPRNAAHQLDFEPILPSSLPMGFVIEGTEVVNPERGHMIGVRITDGLVKGSVYQWPKSDEAKMKFPMQGASVLDIGNVRLMLMADIPFEARQKLLSAFAAAGRRGDKWSSLFVGTIVCELVPVDLDLDFVPWLELPLNALSFH